MALPPEGTPGGSQPLGPPTPVSLQVQILSAEHWSLLASRSLAWNETFARAGMYLSTLSGAIVALALVSQAAEFGPEFVWFALLILPVVLFLGLATFIRQGAANYQDAFCVAGMNRIRAAYFEVAPEVRSYFITSGHDDPAGIVISMATPPGQTTGLIDLFASTPAVVSVLNGVVGAVVAGLVLAQLGVTSVVVIGLGVVAFVLVLGLQLGYAMRSIGRDLAAYRPMFPTPTKEDQRA